jgi:hypothetical protein
MHPNVLTAEKALQAKLDTLIPKENQIEIEFYTNVEKSICFTWRFRYRGNLTWMTYIYANKSVVID